MFYTFDQNNSGGVFEGPETVIIEANNADEANKLAEEKAGIYFNGCDDGIDCECCGDRWYPVYTGKKKALSAIHPQYTRGTVKIYYLNGKDQTIYFGTEEV